MKGKKITLTLSSDEAIWLFRHAKMGAEHWFNQ